MKNKQFWSILSIALLLIGACFAVSCGECEHVWGEWTTVTAATCDTAGSHTRTCAECEEVQTEAIPALGHSFGAYVSNNDANCQRNATETASCTRCAVTDAREIAGTKDPAKHAGTETKYRKNGEDDGKHDKIYACCNAIIETVAHNWGAGAADPDNAGVTVYTCADCGATKKEGDATHTHNAVKVSATPAGCTTFGNIEYWYCAGCDTCFANEALTQEIPLANTRINPSHMGGTATCKAQAVCTRCSNPYGSLDPQNHASTETTYAEHPTDAEKHNKLHACCQAVILTEDHAWDGGTVEGDVTVYECDKCHKTRREPLPVHSHSATHVIARAPSCTETGNVEHWYCAGCGKYFANAALTEERTQAEVTLPAAHTSSEFIYTPSATDPDRHEKKHKCCGTLVELLAHEYELSASYAASCDENGYKVYACDCGKTMNVIVAPALGHNVEFWTLDNETAKTGVNCTYVQTFKGDCFNCGEEVSKQVEAVRHSYMATIVTHATCMTNGTKSYACRDCGATPTPATVSFSDPNAHKWNNGTVEDGVTTYTCENGCGKTKTAIVYAEDSKAVDKSLLEANEIVLGGVSLKLNEAVLGLLENDAEKPVTVSAVPVADRGALINSLPEELRTHIDANTPIYDFTLMQDGSPISTFGENGRITVTLRYELPVGADADRVSVWYVDEQGSLKFYEATYSKIDGVGYATFEASHFSAYLPGLAPAADACELYGHNYQTVVSAPTCTDRGYTEYHCQRCGESKIDDILYALGHAYDEGVGTDATCTAEGQMIYSCTRTDCDHTLEQNIPKKAHAWEYDSEQSVQVSCTTDSLEVYGCGNCSATKTDTENSIKAWGHVDLRPVSAQLAPGATKCSEGVVVTYRCTAEDYNNNYARCTYTEQRTVYEHINIYEFEDNKEEYDPRTPETIMLGEYLTAAGIQYSEEPYIEIKQGCLCGEIDGDIMLYGGMGTMGEMLFNEVIFRAMDRPWPGNPLYDQLVTAVYVVPGPPQYGGGEYSYSIHFQPKLENDGCHYTYSVEIRFGYNETNETFDSSRTIVLAEYDIHLNQKDTATVADPNKTCYENCHDENNQLCYGITVTTVCTDCNETLSTFETSVGTSSSHYFVLDEIYEKNGVKVYIKKCPCGKLLVDKNRGSVTDNAGFNDIYKGSCSFSTSNPDNNTTVYTCTNADHPFIYAVERLNVYDRENCRYRFEEKIYLDCSEGDYTDCERYVACVSMDIEYHSDQTTTNTYDNPEATEYPCYYYWYSETVCHDCEETVSFSEGYRTIHKFASSATAPDAHGNVTTTTVCNEEGCDYLKIELKDADGNVLRSYVSEADYASGELHITLKTAKVIAGALRETMDRFEARALAGGAVIEWYQNSYTYAIGSDGKEGCIKTSTFTNSDGNYYTNEEIICEFGDEINQIKTCTTDGFSKRVCKTCGYEEYSWFESCTGHSFDMWEHVYVTSGMEQTVYRCSYCYEAISKESYPSTDVIVVRGEANDEIMKFEYVNREDPDATSINATYQLVMYAYEEDKLYIDEMTMEPICVTLVGEFITDDGAGHLTLDLIAALEAKEARTPNDGYTYKLTLVIQSTQSASVTYFNIA